ncbi:CMRF35-like molecule 3 [Acipenser ruthenus]|uniref:CMRF35-like molecule 3 n=1 Tax=Acipenser ruthenus TaxID=7906 RepID=UPI002740CB30|nr:CMRF35-like molecule 3 [Acipenser ruthenus]
MELLILLLPSLPGVFSLTSERHVFGWAAGSVSVQCHYDLKYRDNAKYWCRGWRWTSCETLKKTSTSQNDEDKVSISDNKTQGVFTVTVRRLEKEDTDTYWCAIDVYRLVDEAFYINLTIFDATTTPDTPTTTPDTPTTTPATTVVSAGSETIHSSTTIQLASTQPEGRSSSSEFLTVWAVLRWLVFAAMLSSVVLVPRCFERIPKINEEEPETSPQQPSCLSDNLNIHQSP